jgi:hypothetical protein
VVGSRRFQSGVSVRGEWVLLKEYDEMCEEKRSNQSLMRRRGKEDVKGEKVNGEPDSYIHPSCHHQRD